ncbi:MAG: MCE family protein [Aeromicrobium sp.]|uniref:MCE family protein n=1 Tax=Aeromicrobium sp. TaxID=1871063 RepID=UPI0039E3171D
MKHWWIKGMVVLLVALPLVAGCGVLGSGKKHLTVQFTDATGLFRGNDVGIRGVPVGEVISIEPSGSHVNVEIEVDGDIKLPKDVGAVIVSRSVATDRYIELTPAYTSGPVIEDGAVIAADKTKTPVEFEELLGSLQDISNALGAEDGSDGPLHDILASSAMALDGQGQTIANGLSDLSQVLTALTGTMPAVEENLTNLDTLTQTLASNEALVKDFTTQITSAAVMLDQQTGQIQVTFDSIAAMLQGVADFSAAHSDQISGQIDDFVALANELQAHEQEITQLLQNAPLLMQNLPNAIDDEGRLLFRTRPLSLVNPTNELCVAAPALCELVPVEGLEPLTNLLSALQGIQG